VGLYRKTNKTGTYLVVIADGDRGHERRLDSFECSM
jgi:hypothetical protein